jgi:hypothetical protein
MATPDSDLIRTSSASFSMRDWLTCGFGDFGGPFGALSG